MGWNEVWVRDCRIQYHAHANKRWDAGGGGGSSYDIIDDVCGVRASVSGVVEK